MSDPVDCSVYHPDRGSISTDVDRVLVFYAHPRFVHGSTPT